MPTSIPASTLNHKIAPEGIGRFKSVEFDSSGENQTDESSQNGAILRLTVGSLGSKRLISTTRQHREGLNPNAEA